MTNRLHNMEVEEISLVHVPANKCRFLVVKDADGETSLELVPKDTGGFTLVEKDEGVPADAVSAQEVKMIKLTKTDRDALLQDASTALEKLTALAKAIDEAEEVKEGDVPESLSKQLDEMSAAVTDLQEKAKKKKPEEDEEEELKKAWTCECGYKGVPGKGGVCPECGKKMEQDKAAEPTQQTKASETEIQAAELRGMSEALSKMLPRGIEPSDRKDINAGAGSVPAAFDPAGTWMGTNNYEARFVVSVTPWSPAPAISAKKLLGKQGGPSRGPMRLRAPPIAM